MRYLGMAGYYHKFCYNFVTIAAPLTGLLQKKQKFIWTRATRVLLRTVLLMALMLSIPDFNKPFKLFIDASDIGVGGVLLQGIDYRMNGEQSGKSSNLKSPVSPEVVSQKTDQRG